MSTSQLFFSCHDLTLPCCTSFLQQQILWQIHIVMSDHFSFFLELWIFTVGLRSTSEYFWHYHLNINVKYVCFFSTSQLFLLIIYSHKITWMKSHYMSLWKYNCAVHTHYLNKIRGAGWIYCRSTLTFGLVFFHPTRFYKMWTYISQKQSANSVITVWFRWHLYITLNSFHFSTLLNNELCISSKEKCSFVSFVISADIYDSSFILLQYQ